MARRRPPALDRIDIKILAALQRNGRMTIEKLAGLAGLTARPCLERVRRLEAAGIIAGYQAVLALEKLSKPVTIFAEIIMDKQGRSDRLEKRLAGIEEIVECWEVSGDLDYLARFVCADLARYETLTTDLIDDADVGVARIVSHITLRPVRRFAGYPTSLLSPPARAPKRR
jgi:DNA-binding Lrp family transcriptional regulator